MAWAIVRGSVIEAEWVHTCWSDTCCRDAAIAGHYLYSLSCKKGFLIGCTLSNNDSAIYLLRWLLLYSKQSTIPWDLTMDPNVNTRAGTILVFDTFEQSQLSNANVVFNSNSTVCDTYDRNSNEATRLVYLRSVAASCSLPPTKGECTYFISVLTKNSQS